MSRVLRFPSPLQLLLFVALTISGSMAYTQTATLTGQVLDPSGAVVANANVTVTAPATGSTRSASTTSAGVYTFAALPPAIYNVSVDAPGFQTTSRNSVVLNIAAVLPVNFRLAVTGAATTVDVSGNAQPVVETESFQLSTVIDSKQIQDLPLILRDPYQLTLLSPGVVSAANNNGGFSVNGQRDRNNNFMLDGADNNDTSVPGIPGGISSANPDSTQEFRVITNNFDAEFGRNTGAIIDVVTRSGSNGFHGDAYEFGRYNALGARDYFNRKDNGPQDPYVRNDFGASVGGPVWKDHTFFFLNGEVQRFRTSRTENTITPTAAFRTGVFTYTDPGSGSVTHVNLNPANPDNLTGLPFDPTISKVFAVAPVGQSDNGDGATTTYFFASPDKLNDYNLTGRFDHKLSDKHQLTVRYVYGHSADSDPFHDESLPGYGQTANVSTNHNGVISLASQVTTSVTNLLRGSYNQSNTGFFCNNKPFDALLGVDNVGNGRDLTLPGFFNGNAFGCYDLGDSNAQARLTSTILFADTAAITRGAHSVKFGGEFRSVKSNSFDDFFSRANYGFDNFTNSGQDPGAAAYRYGGSADDPGNVNFQDLIWGATGSVSSVSENQFFTRIGARRPSDLTRFRQHEWALFGQDTWKVNSKFTAILGMRYAFNGVPYEKDGNFSNFYGDSSAALPTVGYFSFTSVGPGTDRQLYSDSWGLVEPRVGFAYSVGAEGKTAVRGGFGIFHDRIFDNLFGNARSNPPYQASFNDFPFFGPTPYTLSTAPILGTLTPSASITNIDPATGSTGLEPVTIDGNLKMPTSESYNIGVQHELGSRLSLEVNYVGSHSFHGLREVDAAPPQPNLIASALAAGVKPSSLQSTSLYLRTTFPVVNNTAFFHNLFQTSVVSGNYNGLQGRVQGQVGGLNMTASYTYSHSLDNGSDPLSPGAGNSGLPRNSFDLGPEYGSSDFDVRHRGTIAATYDTPFGPRQRFLNHGFVGRLFEGIELSGIQQVQGGLPFDLRGTRDNLHTGLSNRPQLIGNAYPANRGTKVPQGVITGVNRSAFANAPFDKTLNIHRNKFSGPSYTNTDVVFQKTQTVHESVKIQFRAESYNVLNHPNFTAPASDSISSSLFGVSTHEVGQNDGTTGARQIQGAVKVIF